MIFNDKHANMLISPSRTVIARVELFNSSTLIQTFSHTDFLKEFTVSRAGDKKFFGFGIFQKLELKLVDRERAIIIENGNELRLAFAVDDDIVYPAPPFYVAEVKRDENTNELTITAYDKLNEASKHQINEVMWELVPPYDMAGVVFACLDAIGLEMWDYPEAIDVILNDLYAFPEGANFDGAETIREVLDAVAEATQTIYYLDVDNMLCFKHLDSAAAVWRIDKANYFTLESKGNRKLTTIVNATELGDNISATTGEPGETQYVRDNPLWELRQNIADIVDAAIIAVGGFNLDEFNCTWRGNYLVEPGDRIEIVAKDNSIINSYLLDDKYTYNGGFSAVSTWSYGENETESVDNPSTLGGQLKKTFAKVDKANKEIEIVAGETAAIKMNTDTIQASVTRLDNNMAGVMAEVNAKMSADDVKIAIEKQMASGTNKVITTTGFTFNENGLNISKSDSEINTQITENGMRVYKDNDTVLIADNQGVKAEDLHATTYLIVGNTSRFEDYDNRTGCFWIGR